MQNSLLGYDCGSICGVVRIAPAEKYGRNTSPRGTFDRHLTYP
jgi:hypothetical protein